MRFGRSCRSLFPKAVAERLTRTDDGASAWSSDPAALKVRKFEEIRQVRTVRQRGIHLVEFAFVAPVVFLLMFAVLEPLVVWHQYNAVNGVLTSLAHEAREMEDLQLDFWADDSSDSKANLAKFQAARHSLAEKFSSAIAGVGGVSSMSVTHLDRLGEKGEFKSESLGVLPPSTSAYFAWKLSDPNWSGYLAKNEDVRIAIDDARKPGLGTGSQYQEKYGLRGGNATDLEKFFLGICKRWLGRDASDASEFTREELAECHYRSHGWSEKRALGGSVKESLSDADWKKYLEENEDVKVAIDDVIQDGVLEEGEFQRRWGVGRAGTAAQLEEFFVRSCNKLFGGNATDASAYTKEQLAQCHWSGAGLDQWRRLDSKPREVNNAHLCGIEPEGDFLSEASGDSAPFESAFFRAKFSALIRSGKAGEGKVEDIRSWCNIRATTEEEMPMMSRLSELSKHVPTELVAPVEFRGVAPGLTGGYRWLVAVPYWPNKMRNGMYRDAAAKECSWGQVEWSEQPTACGPWSITGIQKDSCGNQRVVNKQGCNPCDTVVSAGSWSNGAECFGRCGEESRNIVKSNMCGETRSETETRVGKSCAEFRTMKVVGEGEWSRGDRCDGGSGTSRRYVQEADECGNQNTREETRFYQPCGNGQVHHDGMCYSSSLSTEWTGYASKESDLKLDTGCREVEHASTGVDRKRFFSYCTFLKESSASPAAPRPDGFTDIPGTYAINEGGRCESQWISCSAAFGELGKKYKSSECGVFCPDQYIEAACRVMGEGYQKVGGVSIFPNGDKFNLHGHCCKVNTQTWGDNPNVVPAPPSVAPVPDLRITPAAAAWPTPTPRPVVTPRPRATRPPAVSTPHCETIRGGPNGMMTNTCSGTSSGYTGKRN